MNQSANAVLLACCLFVVLGRVRSLNLLADVQDVKVINGALNSDRAMTFQCIKTDMDTTFFFSVQNDAGSTRAFNLTCNAPVREYNIYYYAKVPADGMLLRTKVCNVRGTDPLVPAGNDSSVLTNLDDTATMRKLLSVQEEEAAPTSRKLLGIFDLGNRFYGCPKYLKSQCDEIRLRPLVEGTGNEADHVKIDYFTRSPYGRNAFEVAATVAAKPWYKAVTGTNIGLPNAPYSPTSLEIAAQCIGSGRDCTDPKYASLDGDGKECVPCWNGQANVDFDSLRTQLENRASDLVKANDQAMKQLGDLADQEARVLGNVTAGFQQLNNYANALEATTKLILDNIGNLYSTQSGFEQSMLSEFDKQATRKDNTTQIFNSSLAVFGEFATRSGRREDQIMAEMFRLSSDIMTQIANLTRFAGKLQRDRTEKWRGIGRHFIDYFSRMERVFSREAIMNQLTARVQLNMENPNVKRTAAGLDLIPFADDLGLKPASGPSELGESLAAVAMSNTVFRYVATDPRDGVSYGYETRLVYRCSTMNVIQYGQYEPDKRTLVEMLGPLLCDESFNQQASNGTLRGCLCYITIDDKRCPLASVASPDLDGFLDGIEPSYSNCLVTPIQQPYSLDGLDNEVVRVTDELAETMAIITNRGIYPGTHYHVKEFITGQAVTVPYSLYLSNTSYFTDAVFYPDEPISTPATSIGLNLAFTFLTLTERSYMSVYANADPLRDRVFGTLPSNVTFREQITSRSGNRTMGSCVEAGLMLLTTQNMLTVSSAIASTVSATVTYSLEGETAQTLTDVTITNPFDFLLKKFTDFVWDPSKKDEFWYNTPNGQVVTSPNPRRTAGLVTYNSFVRPDLADGLTRAAWQREHGMDYNDFDGNNVASLYKVALDGDTSSPTYGECIAGPVRYPGAAHCLLREHFRFVVQPGGYNQIGVPERFSLIDRDATTTFTVRVPQGRVAQVLSSVCPIVVGPRVEQGSLFVQLVNPVAENNLVLVEQVGRCPSSSRVTIAPRATLGLRFESCRLAPVDDPDYVVISLIDSGDDTTSLCPGRVDLSMTTQVRDGWTDLPVSGAFVFATTDYFTDVIASELARTVYEVTAAQIEQLDESLNMHFSMRFTMPNISFGGYEDLVEKAAANAKAALDAAEAAKNDKFDTDALKKGLDEELDKRRPLIQAKLAELSRALDAIREQNDKTKDSIATAKAIAEATDLSMQDLFNKTEAFGYSIVEFGNLTYSEEPYGGEMNVDPEEDDTSTADRIRRVGRAAALLVASPIPDGLLSGLFGDFPDVFSGVFSGGGIQKIAIGLVVTIAIIIAVFLLLYGVYYICRTRAFPTEDEKAEAEAVKLLEVFLGGFKSLTIPKTFYSFFFVCI